MNKSIDQKTKENLFAGAYPSIVFMMDATGHKNGEESIVLPAIFADLCPDKDKKDILSAYAGFGPLFMESAQAYLDCFAQLDILDEFEKWSKNESRFGDAFSELCSQLIELYNHAQDMMDGLFDLCEGEGLDEADAAGIDRKIGNEPWDEDDEPDEDFIEALRKAGHLRHL